LVHEIAHLLTYERHGHRVKPHGEEWKNAFKELMRPVMRLEVFPEDVRNAIISYMRDPGASSCSDIDLMRVLRKHDRPNGFIHLETLPMHAEFDYGGKIFIKGEKRRTRYQCKDKLSGHVYLFSGLADVKTVS
jgi:hypothetical protein